MWLLVDYNDTILKVREDKSFEEHIVIWNMKIGSSNIEESIIV